MHLTMSDKKGTTTIRVIQFSGKQADWPVWKEKFLARARRSGYKTILLGKTSVPKDSVDLDTITDETMRKRLKEIRILNEDAYEELLLSIDGDSDAGRIAFNLVRSAKTVELADGDAKLAWELLEKKFEARTTPSRLLLRNKITGMKLRDYKQDPAVFIMKLESLIEQYKEAGGNWNDDDTLEHIMMNLPRCYEVVIHPLKMRIGSTTDPVTIRELQDQLSQKYDEMFAHKTFGRD